MIGGPERSTRENGIYNQYTSTVSLETIAGDAYISNETGSQHYPLIYHSKIYIKIIYVKSFN